MELTSWVVIEIALFSIYRTSSLVIRLFGYTMLIVS
jgi:hypothetical protein